MGTSWPVAAGRTESNRGAGATPPALKPVWRWSVPRIKRWFPVSHDINADAEIWAMRREIGEKSLSVWLEILSISDRNESELPGDYQALVRSIAGKCQATTRTVSAVFEFAKSRLWVISQPTLRVANYWKYHKTRDPKQIPRGNITGSLPSEPSEPILPKETLKRKGKDNGEQPIQALDHHGKPMPTPPAWKGYVPFSKRTE